MRCRWISLLILVWAAFAQAAPVDRSDLNGDGAVDTQDIQIFSSRYLGQDWTTVDWCAFYESSITNPKYFREITSDKVEHFQLLLNVIAETFDCTVIVPTGDKSDLDGDGDVDLDDLVSFSTIYLERHWESVDWCVFHGSTLAGVDFEGRSTRYFLQHFTLLLTFINTYFECGGAEPPAGGLILENAPKFLTRIEVAANGDFYVTDPRIGSLFIFDEFLVLQGEIKGLSKPLGVAVDMQGRILVGNNGRDNVEVYDPANGELLAVFGEGLVRMPNAITLDGAGNITLLRDPLGGETVFTYDAEDRITRIVFPNGTVRDMAAAAIEEARAEAADEDDDSQDIDAAVEAGVITEDEDLPNDFFIDNRDSVLELLHVTESAVIEVISSDDVTNSLVIDVEQLKALYEGDYVGSDVYGIVPGQPIAMDVSIRDGLITGLSAVYLP